MKLSGLRAESRSRIGSGMLKASSPEMNNKTSASQHRFYAYFFRPIFYICKQYLDRRAAWFEKNKFVL